MSTAAEAAIEQRPQAGEPDGLCVSDWKPIVSGPLVGRFNVGLPNGMIIRGCLVSKGTRGLWVAMPSAAHVERGKLKLAGDGQPLYKRVVDFTSGEAYARFQTAVLDALRQRGCIE